jgi:plasmid maintenance system antidote protein VapI
VIHCLAISIDSACSLARIFALLEVASLVRRAVRVDGALRLTTDLGIAVEFWQARASRFSIQKNAFGVNTARARVA